MRTFAKLFDEFFSMWNILQNSPTTNAINYGGYDYFYAFSVILFGKNALRQCRIGVHEFIRVSVCLLVSSARRSLICWSSEICRRFGGHTIGWISMSTIHVDSVEFHRKKVPKYWKICIYFYQSLFYLLVKNCSCYGWFVWIAGSPEMWSRHLTYVIYGC